MALLTPVAAFGTYYNGDGIIHHPTMHYPSVETGSKSMEIGEEDIRPNENVSGTDMTLYYTAEAAVTDPYSATTGGATMTKTYRAVAGGGTLESDMMKTEESSDDPIAGLRHNDELFILTPPRSRAGSFESHSGTQRSDSGSSWTTGSDPRGVGIPFSGTSGCTSAAPSSGRVANPFPTDPLPLGGTTRIMDGDAVATPQVVSPDIIPVHRPIGIPAADSPVDGHQSYELFSPPQDGRRSTSIMGMPEATANMVFRVAVEVLRSFAASVNVRNMFQKFLPAYMLHRRGSLLMEFNEYNERSKPIVRYDSPRDVSDWNPSRDKPEYRYNTRLKTGKPLLRGKSVRETDLQWSGLNAWWASEQHALTDFKSSSRKWNLAVEMLKALAIKASETIAMIPTRFSFGRKSTETLFRLDDFLSLSVFDRKFVWELEERLAEQWKVGESRVDAAQGCTTARGRIIISHDSMDSEDGCIYRQALSAPKILAILREHLTLFTVVRQSEGSRTGSGQSTESPQGSFAGSQQRGSPGYSRSSEVGTEIRLNINMLHEGDMVRMFLAYLEQTTDENAKMVLLRLFEIQQYYLGLGTLSGWVEFWQLLTSFVTENIFTLTESNFIEFHNNFVDKLDVIQQSIRQAVANRQIHIVVWGRTSRAPSKDVSVNRLIIAQNMNQNSNGQNSDQNISGMMMKGSGDIPGSQGNDASSVNTSSFLGARTGTASYSCFVRSISEIFSTHFLSDGTIPTAIYDGSLLEKAFKCDLKSSGSSSSSSGNRSVSDPTSSSERGAKRGASNSPGEIDRQNSPPDSKVASTREGVRFLSSTAGCDGVSICLSRNDMNTNMNYFLLAFGYHSQFITLVPFWQSTVFAVDFDDNLFPTTWWIRKKEEWEARRSVQRSTKKRRVEDQDVVASRTPMVVASRTSTESAVAAPVPTLERQITDESPEPSNQSMREEMFESRNRELTEAEQLARRKKQIYAEEFDRDKLTEDDRREFDNFMSASFGFISEIVKYGPMALVSASASNWVDSDKFKLYIRCGGEGGHCVQTWIQEVMHKSCISSKDIGTEPPSSGQIVGGAIVVPMSTSISMGGPDEETNANDEASANMGVATAMCEATSDDAMCGAIAATWSNRSNDDSAYNSDPMNVDGASTPKRHPVIDGTEFRNCSYLSVVRPRSVYEKVSETEDFDNAIDFFGEKNEWNDPSSAGTVEKIVVAQEAASVRGIQHEEGGEGRHQLRDYSLYPYSRHFRACHPQEHNPADPSQKCNPATHKIALPIYCQLEGVPKETPDVFKRNTMLDMVTRQLWESEGKKPFTQLISIGNDINSEGVAAWNVASLVGEGRYFRQELEQRLGRPADAIKGLQSVKSILTSNILHDQDGEVSLESMTRDILAIKEKLPQIMGTLPRRIGTNFHYIAPDFGGAF